MNECNLYFVLHTVKVNVVWTIDVLQVLNDMTVSKWYYYLYNTIEGAITIPIVFTPRIFILFCTFMNIFFTNN